ncbi:MAG: hemolysin family protein [PVC group bacterium]
MVCFSTQNDRTLIIPGDPGDFAWFFRLFSGSETALFSLPPFTVEKLKHQKPGRGTIIYRLLSNPRRLLVSIVASNMLVNIFSATLAARVASTIFASGPLRSLAWIFSTVVMTFVILICGEVTPKVLAINRSEKLALAVAPAISLLERVMTPVRVVVNFLSDWILAVFEKSHPARESPLTREELTAALDLGSREGTLNGEEREMITEIFKLGDKSVRQLRTPRNEMVVFEIDTPLEEIAAVIREKEYSRIPIYSGKMENIVGILYPKDLVMAQARGVERPVLGDFLRRPFFIPETMKASRLLKEFLERKVHVALVVDEYGGLAGLITMEDLIEEIVGEIRQQGESPREYEIVDENTVRVRGRLELSNINNELKLDLAGKRSVTLGGLICERLGHIPQPGEVWQEGDIRFTVVNLKKHRIGQVEIRGKGIGARLKKEGPAPGNFKKNVTSQLI